MWMIVNCKNGVSSWEIHRALKVTQKSTWFMLHRLRLAMKEDFGNGPMTKIGGPESEVEVDETFVGGRKQNMHKDKKIRYEAKGGASGKAVVQGILDRTARQVRAKVMPDVKRETLQSEILRQVKYGTKVYTDDAVAYEQGMQWRFVHDFVNKTETYVKGRVHVNGVDFSGGHLLPNCGRSRRAMDQTAAARCTGCPVAARESRSPAQGPQHTLASR